MFLKRRRFDVAHARHGCRAVARKRATIGLGLSIAAVMLTGCDDSGGSNTDMAAASAEDTLANRRVNPGAGINAKNADKLDEAWRVTGDDPVSHMPLVQDGVVYFADWGGNVYAVDLTSGDTVWKKAIGDPKKEWPWHGFAGTGALGEDQLFEASVEGEVYAIDQKTGEVNWSTHVAEGPHGGNLSKLLYHSGTVYIGLASVDEPLSKEMPDLKLTFRGQVVALNAKDGSEVWRKDLVKSPHNGVAVWSGFALDPDRNILFFDTGNNYTGDATDLSDSMIAVDTKNGDTLWSYQVTSHDVWIPPMAIGPDYDFGAGPQLFSAKDGDGNSRPLVGAGQKNGFYSVFDRTTGKHVWSTFVGYAAVGGGIRGAASIEDGKIYLFSNNGYEDGKPPEKFPMTVKALDAATGDNLWTQDKAQPANGASSGFLADGVYFVGSLDGTLQGYRASDGKVLWTEKAPGAIASSLNVAGDFLLAGIGVPKSFAGSESSAHGVIAYKPSK